MIKDAIRSAGRLVLASHNPGKLKEIGDLVAPFGIAAVSAGALGLPEPDETETTFAGNALLKARAAAIGANLPALADDSGFCVAALGGAPGVLSARWAGPEKDFAAAMRQVWERVAASGSPDRGAWFVCALAIALPDGQSTVVEGRVDGALAWPPRGANGFGYDPMFLPAGGALTFGEMAPAAKHAVSHRAQAFAQLAAFLG